ncbi:hypothetical protein RASY3_14500 [Ruminococcus albus SY3]|uniref:Uncharacterized protein n=1 Tax=Ruminococcus albus SY3 TaxID=1341156 RepID=A0A011VTH8_RUMAL|nr:hypothetical protein [Ruminococcus albus]EXM38531.1 hypothetical protein RASY3_14500 [Ruminococcus albus SY3]
MIKDFLREGELVTALPNDDYGYTTDGWTAYVLALHSGYNGEVSVQGYNDRGNVTSPDWAVDPEVLIPYSENMVTQSFRSFKVHPDAPPVIF